MAMKNETEEKFNKIQALFSDTPLLEFSLKYNGEPCKVYAKAEYYSLTGSIKDRVAYYILKKAFENGEIASGDVIAEATSGNTGIAFSALGRMLGHKVIIFMPDWMSRERIDLMKSFGAEVKLVSREQGGFLGSIRMTEELAAGGGVFLPRQFSNTENIQAHYHLTGEEISRQLAKIGVTPDGFVAGVGTGGTVMGVGRRLQRDNPQCAIFPLEPKNSPTLSTGYKVGKHRIQGISDEFIPPILNLNEARAVISVDDVDSIIMSQMISRRFGIGIGISGGANFLGALRAQKILGFGSNVITVFADDNKKYLSTDYSEEHEIKPEYMTSKIELLDVRAYR